MAKNHPEIPVIELSGNPTEIGVAHGESLRDRIREYTDRFLGWLLSDPALALTEETLWSRWAPQVAVNERLASDLVEEMRGISRGAGVSFERIFLLNSLLDLMSFRHLPMAQNFGCSTFAVSSEPGTGKTLLGQTYDMPELQQDFVTLLRLNPTNGPRQLIFTFAGIVGACGMNEVGIGLCINYLSPLDVGLGKLHSIVVRQILEKTNLADALTPPVVPPRAGGAHYLVADTDGNVISIETTGQRYHVVYPEGNAIGHTNHYLAGGLKEVEHVRENSIGSSLARYTALRRFLRDNQDRLDVAALQELTRNHTAYPRSICVHGSESEPKEGRGRTVAAMVQVLDGVTMYITNGCACEKTYHPVEL